MKVIKRIDAFCSICDHYSFSLLTGKPATDEHELKETNAINPSTKIMMMGTKEAEIVCYTPSI